MKHPVARTTDTSWMKDAACRGHDTGKFFKDGGQGNVITEKQAAQAQAICTTCPVSERCLDYALGNKIRHGIWGGLLPRNRRKLERQR